MYYSKVKVFYIYQDPPHLVESVSSPANCDPSPSAETNPPCWCARRMKLSTLPSPGRTPSTSVRREERSESSPDSKVKQVPWARLRWARRRTELVL